MASGICVWGLEVGGGGVDGKKLGLIKSEIKTGTYCSKLIFKREEKERENYKTVEESSSPAEGQMWMPKSRAPPLRMRLLPVLCQQHHQRGAVGWHGGEGGTYIQSVQQINPVGVKTKTPSPPQCHVPERYVPNTPGLRIRIRIGSGSWRAKMTLKRKKKIANFIF